MLNELYSLSETIGNKGIAVKEWHREYKQLPKVSKKSPCIRIWLTEDGTIREIESLSADLVQNLRKFGNNQGTFPAFNIAPLYRLTDKEQIERLEAFEKDPFLLDLDEVKNWCVNNNWRSSLNKKVNNCLHGTSNRLLNFIIQQGAEQKNPVSDLIHIADSYSNESGNSFREALEKCVFGKLQRKEDIITALAILFHKGNPMAKDVEKDTGTLSVILDLFDWQQYGHPVASEYMTEWINEILLKAERLSNQPQLTDCMLDAFRTPFINVDEPMPSVRLKGFDVTLRTMFAGQPCQTRYGNIENSSYPIGHKNRALVKKSLEWLANEEREGITWQRVDKNEIVFVYPSRILDVPLKFASILGPQGNNNSISLESRFERVAEEFVATFRGIPPKQQPDYINVFAIRKMDKARSKVVFTRNCSPEQLIAAAKEWETGCRNTPESPVAPKKIPFPLQTAGIINNVWKQNGELANQGKTVVERMKYYQGLELLLDHTQESLIRYYLHILLSHSSGLLRYVGNWAHGGANRPKRMKDSEKQENEVGLVMSLIGLLLYKCGYRKEIYMESMAYLVGQLLKISDELHALYCRVVRDGKIPPQLVGSSLFVTASETPIQALAQLSVRINPYITWAKQYRAKNISNKGEESWRAGWYLSLYEDIANKILPKITESTRFDDLSKSQLFLGYLSSFPQREKSVTPSFNGEAEIL